MLWLFVFLFVLGNVVKLVIFLLDEGVNSYNILIQFVNFSEMNFLIFLDDILREFFYEFVYVFYLFVIFLIFIFGIIGNVLFIKVFLCFIFNKQFFSIYFVVLFVFDMWFLVVLLMGWFGSFDGII